MGRHRPLWLCSARYGFAFIGILQRLLWARVRPDRYLAVMASFACYGLRDFASYAVPVMGKSQFFVLGYPPSPSVFVVRV